VGAARTHQRFVEPTMGAVARAGCPRGASPYSPRRAPGPAPQEATDRRTRNRRGPPALMLRGVDGPGATTPSLDGERTSAYSPTILSLETGSAVVR